MHLKDYHRCSIVGYRGELMKNFLSLFSILTLAFATAAHADAQGAGSNVFQDRVTAYQESCAKECQYPFSTRVLQNSNLGPVAIKHLKEIAVDQAQIWADTILEGDYHADGDTRLDSVLAIFENGTFLGYKITYSEKAWYVGDCNFSDSNLSTLARCEEGRIHESSFVSPDFNTYFRDETDFADFEN